MSLLLDARKKSQAAQGEDASRSGTGTRVEEQSSAGNASAFAPPITASHTTQDHTPPIDNSARMAGQNLFRAKLPSAFRASAAINRNLLIALAGTLMLLIAGGGYVWYVTSASNNQPSRPIARAPVAAPPITQQAPVMADVSPAPVTPEAASSVPASAKQTVRAARRAAKIPSQTARANPPLNIERHQVDAMDPLLSSAYQAYREGRFEQAQQLYLEALKLDARNADALLGLAAIAQRRGADSVAAHYYAKVLELNPRDPVANAGMSALTANENIESRLKILLNEQGDSSALHFALGNLYAAQQRWAKAQQAYFQAYKLAPENAALAFHLALSLDRLGQKKLAAQYYQEALQLDPSHSEGFDHAKISIRIDELTR